MNAELRRLIPAIGAAAVLWFLMFSPWTGGMANFWLMMSGSALILAGMAFALTPDRKELLKVERPLLQLLCGIALAFLLWGLFWIGDRLSSLMFTFARGQVDAVYGMKTGLPAWVIALLLLLVIGPAEELFWRGYVQRSFAKIFKSKDTALVVTTLIYALVHIWSFNFMLVMAALVAGAFWGLIYRFRPQALPALVVSHAVWDALVFVILPI